MHDLPVSYVETHMSGIAHDISRLGFRIGYPASRTPAPVGRPWHRVSEVLVDSPHESGAVRTLGQAGASRHVGIPDKLAGIIRNLLALAAGTRVAGRRSIIVGAAGTAGAFRAAGGTTFPRRALR